MTKMRLALAVSGLAVTLVGLTGCQTQLAGMTLPSGRYLEHRPQYFPREPNHPLPRELATQQSYSAAADAALPGSAAGRSPSPLR